MSTGKKKTILTSVQRKEITWKQAMEQYLLWKKAEGRSAQTIRDYYCHITHFMKVYPATAINDDNNALKRDVIAYMAEDVKPAYYNRKLVYLKTFFIWCINESNNPPKSFKRRKADQQDCRCK